LGTFGIFQKFHIFSTFFASQPPGCLPAVPASQPVAEADFGWATGGPGQLTAGWAGWDPEEGENRGLAAVLEVW